MTVSVIRLKEVKARTGLSRSTIYAKIAAGLFPAPIPLGARAVAWVEAEISEWIERQIARRIEGQIGQQPTTLEPDGNR